MAIKISILCELILYTMVISVSVLWEIVHGSEYDEVYAYPVFYLKKDITLNGAGTKSDPYVIE